LTRFSVIVSEETRLWSSGSSTIGPSKVTSKLALAEFCSAGAAAPLTNRARLF
jgi:hypothetical protein